MRKHLWLLPCLFSCLPGPKQPATPAANPNPKEPPLALEEDRVDWVDPEAAYPTARATERNPRAVAPPIVIRHATILTATGKRIDDGAIVLKDGLISAIGDSSL